jgi:hypothetical protein
VKDSDCHFASPTRRVRAPCNPSTSTSQGSPVEDHQRPTTRSSGNPPEATSRPAWWRASSSNTHRRSPPLGLAAGEHGPPLPPVNVGEVRVGHAEPEGEVGIAQLVDGAGPSGSPDRKTPPHEAGAQQHLQGMLDALRRLSAGRMGRQKTHGVEPHAERGPAPQGPPCPEHVFDGPDAEPVSTSIRCEPTAI